MSSIKFLCQKFEIIKGDKSYTYLLGAGDPKDILKIAAAPSFGSSTPHHEIVDQILKPPTTKWQRPLIEKKVKSIAQIFENSNEIMPNPILLAVNPNSKINVSRYKTADGAESELFQVEVTDTGGNDTEKPLWIIDGQHRVSGLAKVEVGKNTLPFVLLYSDTGLYVSEILAKIFAQVTTQATALDQIHKAWMEFVFKLDKYTEKGADWRAMRTSALLCQTQMYNDEPNPFYDNVGFNPDLFNSEAKASGFIFDAVELSKLIKDGFFIHAGNPRLALSEEDVAASIGSAVYALKKIHKGDRKTSAFFGDVQNQQKYFKEGFIVGIGSYLLAHDRPRDWEKILKNLKFDEANWEVSSWVNNTSGAAGNLSKRIAFKCFESVFKNAKYPDGVEDIVEYLQGASSRLTIDAWELNESNKKIAKSHFSTSVEFAGNVDVITKSVPKDARIIQITNPSLNIGSMEIRNAKSPMDPFFYATEFRRGKELKEDDLGRNRQLSLLIKVEYYGGRAISKTLNIKFDKQ